MLPLDQRVMHLGQNLARCPRTTLEVGWWLRGFRRASSTALVRRARHRHVAPCVVCALGLPQLVVLAAARRPPRPTHLAISPERMPLTPPASRHARSGDRNHDLLVARPTLSPVELAGDPCVCVCVCVCGVCVCVCVTPNLFNQSNSIRYDTPPLYSSVRIATMLGSSARRGLSSLSQRQQDYIQLMHPAPCSSHMHAPFLMQGPPTGEPAFVHGDGVTDAALHTVVMRIIVSLSAFSALPLWTSVGPFLVAIGGWGPPSPR